MGPDLETLRIKSSRCLERVVWAEGPERKVLEAGGSSGFSPNSEGEHVAEPSEQGDWKQGIGPSPGGLSAIAASPLVLGDSGNHWWALKGGAPCSDFVLNQ